MAMKAKQVKDLWEAYSKVYQNLDEVKSSESSAANYLEKDKKIPPGTKVQVKPMEEEVDVYDLIRSYLIDEGYAETPEAAFAIMANMSDGWRKSIVEQSAIGARAAKVVGDQRQGYHGDSDAINKLQDAASRSMGRLKKGQGPVVTPGLPGV